jgi:vacuolar-type H+-ATPase catalytic subunit A/Vma1
VDIPSLNLGKQWQFTPGNFREGQIISGGDIFGTVRASCTGALHCTSMTLHCVAAPSNTAPLFGLATPRNSAAS